MLCIVHSNVGFWSVGGGGGLNAKVAQEIVAVAIAVAVAVVAVVVVAVVVAVVVVVAVAVLVAVAGGGSSKVVEGKVESRREAGPAALCLRT